MVNFKKFVAILCSATMVAATPVSALASDPSSTAATGNIVAYSVETVTVPTAIKVSFNPQKWDFVLDASDTGSVTNAQIVSLNYGISSMATMDRKVSIEFEATGEAGETGEPVVFVGTAAEATSKLDEDTPGTAEFGEYKIYLAVAPASAAVAKNRAEDLTFGIGENGAVNFDGDDLADVSMTAVAANAQAFVAGSENLADAAIAFKLGKATYALKENQYPTFGATQATFADLVEPSAIGDIVGFTFTGAMNADADWTKANLTAIKIEPTYEIDDVDGSEEEIDGGYNQIKAGASAAAATEVTGSYDSTNTQYRINLAAAVTAVSDITNFKVNGNTVAINGLNSSKNLVKVDRSAVKSAVGSDWDTATSFDFTFTVNGVNYKCTIAKNG